MHRTLIVVALIYCFTTNSPADIIHVPEDYPTIQEGVNFAAPNDTVIVAEGTYDLGGLLIDKPLTLASTFFLSRDSSVIERTILRALPAAGSEWFYVTKNAENTLITGLRIEGNTEHSLGIANAYSSVTYCQFIRGKDQLSFEGWPENPAGGYVAYCYFQDAWDDAIDCDFTTSWTVEYNTIVDAHQDGIEVRLHDKQGPMTTHIIRHNKIIGSGESGVQLINYEGDSFREFHIYGNIIKDCRGVGVSCMYNTQTLEDFKGSNMEEHAYIYNNTIDGCSYGMTQAPRLVVLNNIISNCRVKGIGRSVHVTAENDHSIVDYTAFFNNPLNYDSQIVVGANIFEFDPEFVNRSDYRLLPTSPCINRGIAQYTWEGRSVLDLAAEDYIGPAPDLGAVEFDQPSTMVETAEHHPDRFSLMQNYPNPFNGSTTIRFVLRGAGEVSISIFNSYGQVVDTQNGFYPPGEHSRVWSATDQLNRPLPSGLYLCQLRNEAESKTIKMLLLN